MVFYSRKRYVFTTMTNSDKQALIYNSERVFFTELGPFCSIISARFVGDGILLEIVCLSIINARFVCVWGGGGGVAGVE